LAVILIPVALIFALVFCVAIVLGGMIAALSGNN
jgi:hypothetical protein